MNEREYNAISSARKTRKTLVENKIINEEQRLLGIDDLLKIINFFGGKLSDSLDQDGYLIKPDYNQFEIFCKTIKTPDFKIKCDPFFVMNGFGKLITNFDNIKVGEKVPLSDYDNYDLALSHLFAREFIMPDKILSKSLSEHTIYEDDGNKMDLVSVAKDFGTEEKQVIMKLKFDGYTVS